MSDTNDTPQLGQLNLTGGTASLYRGVWYSPTTGQFLDDVQGMTGGTMVNINAPDLNDDDIPDTVIPHGTDFVLVVY